MYLYNTSNDKILSSLIKKAWCTCTFLNYFAEANEQLLWSLLLNTDKCHLLLNSQEPNTLKIGDLHINNSLSEKLLGVTFDCKLKFNKHIKDISQKASQKINVLTRLAPYMETTKKRVLKNAFFKSQFNYCPLVWMCCNRSLNTKINRLHEWCLKVKF